MLQALPEIYGFNILNLQAHIVVARKATQSGIGTTQTKVLHPHGLAKSCATSWVNPYKQAILPLGPFCIRKDQATWSEEICACATSKRDASEDAHCVQQRRPESPPEAISSQSNGLHF
jgi:hypothetical protein